MEPAVNAQDEEKKMVGYLVSLLLLAILAAEDIREKKISAPVVAVSAIMAVIYHMISGGFYWEEVVAGLFPGGMLVLLSFLTGESIGYGDGALVMVLGLWNGGSFALSVTSVGIMLAGVYGGWCLIKRKNEPIAFVPFLLLGMEVTLFYA